MPATVSVLRTKRILFTGLLLLALVVWAVAVAQAGSLSSKSIEQSTSEPGATGVQHVLSFTLDRAQVARTQPAGDYSRTVNYTVLPYF